MKYFFGYILFMIMIGYSAFNLYMAWDTSVVSIIGGGGGSGIKSYALEESKVNFYFTCLMWFTWMLGCIYALLKRSVVYLYRRIKGIELLIEPEENEFTKRQDNNNFVNYKGKNDFFGRHKKGNEQDNS